MIKNLKSYVYITNYVIIRHNSITVTSLKHMKRNKFQRINDCPYKQYQENR